MKKSTLKDRARYFFSRSSCLLTLSCLLFVHALWSKANYEHLNEQELRERVHHLQRELEGAKRALANRKARSLGDSSEGKGDSIDTKQETDISGANRPVPKTKEGATSSTLKGFSDIFEGFSFGGAIRVNYVLGNYDDAPKRGNSTRGDGGAIALDTFRLNLDYERENWIGKAEYRFYPGLNQNNSDSYHFFHTGWLGYRFQDGSEVQAGLNRVPFGHGPYGTSKSWFFDQHYYLGFADDMDLGVKYKWEPTDKWSMDIGAYVTSEGNGTGNNFSRDSVRYSYDVVNESGSGYEEFGQLNLRAIRQTSLGNSIEAHIGFSGQYGRLESQGIQDDGHAFAASFHPVFN